MRIPITSLLLLSLYSFSISIANASPAAGMVKTLTGTAQIERGDQTVPVKVGSAVRSSDRITTGKASSIGITMQDNTRLTAGANAVLDLNEYRFNTTTHDGKLNATLKRGSLAVISGKMSKANPNAVKFNTGTVTLGVRGTEFIIEAGSFGGE